MTGRRTRRLLLAAIAALLFLVGAAYRFQTQWLRRTAPAKPEALPLHLSASAQDWEFTNSAPDGRPIVAVRARDFRQIKESGLIELEHVELHLFHENGKQYDLVKSAHAQFRQADRSLYSDGEVEIILGVPAEGPPPGGLVSIHTSGVTFDGQGKAVTERPATFLFENGDGRAVGASYDPTAKELLMKSEVELNWHSPGSTPLHIEAGQLSYKEALSAILLYPWARLEQGPARIEGGDTIVTLENGVIRRVESQRAKGSAEYPKQMLEYSAGHLVADVSADGAIEKVVGEPDARLVSTTAGARTTITTARIDLEFVSLDGESVLKRALASGRGVVESRTTAGPAPGDTRILRSEVIETLMRPGGEEIERVETHAPGRIELIPAAASARRRSMDGERIAMNYAAGNQLETLQAVNVSTRTEPPAQSPRKIAVVQTWSKGLRASFSSKTGQMQRLEQWEDFRYEEGSRQARAGSAAFEPDLNRMILQANARVWDPSGSTSAETIRLEQETGRFTAEGKVASTRLPDDPARQPARGRNADSGLTGLVEGNQPVQATADRMISEDGQTRIRYLGRAVLWQKGSRVQADEILIDRAQRRLVASGSVFTEFLDQEPGKRAGPPEFTRIRAARLVYTDAGRLAHYTGGAALTRPNLKVNGRELRAWLAEPDEPSRVERFRADGQARIEQVLPDRTRTGTAEQAEYLALEEKLILRGGDPQFVDSLRGATRGAELTYFLNDDRLLVSGQAKQPAFSRILRR